MSYKKHSLLKNSLVCTAVLTALSAMPRGQLILRGLSGGNSTPLDTL
jgi:hypothetical protein